MKTTTNNLTEAELDAILATVIDRMTADQEETAIATAERFTIDSEEKAEWLLRKLSAITAEKEKIAANATKRTAELDADYARLMGRFGADLETFARAEAERRRRKTVTLLSGTLSFRTVPASIRFGNPADALTTAKAVLPSAVTVETIEQLDKRAFMDFAKRHFDDLGELLPGVERTEQRESFSIG